MRVTYTYIEELGSGGFGKVWKVQNESRNIFARKELNLDIYASEHHAELRKRFAKEVRYQSQLNNPHLVPILDSDVDCDNPWFVMPCAIESLEDEMRRDKAIEGRYADVLSQILNGLEALHNANLSHRDLKPANVLKFMQMDGSFQYKISDFGLSTPGIGNTTTLTMTGAEGGTLNYRAPECAVDFRRATHLADIYSFGAILHDIFGNASDRVPHIELHVDGPLSEVVEKCTKTQPRRRYSSISELRGALFLALSEASIEFNSADEQKIIELLNENSSLDSRQWDRFIDFVERHPESKTNIFRAFTSNHIDALFLEEIGLFNYVGDEFCKFLSNGIFGFEFCDVLNNRAKAFYANAEGELKAKLTLALLSLGTSHNRWYVEGTFMDWVSPKADDAFIDRLIVEIKAELYPFSIKFDHVKRSIDVDESKLHPKLQEFLNQ